MKPSNRSNQSPLISESMLRKLIIFENDDIIVVNKPGWLVCHPSKNGPWSSLVGAVRELCGLESVYLVGRLDRETSGVVLIGKNKAVGRKWQKDLEEKRVKRSYFAILEGCLSEQVEINNFIGNDPESKVFVKQKVTTKTHKSKQAETLLLPLYSNSIYTLVCVLTKTGRKHQIRLHAQSIGFPLVGEKLYGHDESYYLKFCENGWDSSWLSKLGMERQALHARRFGYFGDELLFEAILPNDFLNFMENKMEFKKEYLSELIERSNSWELKQLNIN